ncbi:maleylpyruvate isomerase family mycothiol-dependent enzyme [Nocardiopsis sp. ATB16-24]|uniref:maleylpyruvate isomerase family mycothiol-dependent enzyme n=1 Tax=Nocardiopsis sp. ATB16-24 TaxID=3019555 RepID=UPI00255499A3|nr:maleylpyruvate isomerase family mycothiol-dependent enzyme [Nocardiopsis sp. ATB16-24]
MFDRDVVVRALSAEVGVLRRMLSGVSEEEAVLPTRCPPWDVAALAVHTVGALHRVLVVLDAGTPEGSGPLVSAAGYYAPDVRFSPTVNADRVERAVRAAEGRADAAEPGRVLETWWKELSTRLSVEPVDRVVVTRHGDPMLLTDFLVTRVLELVVHGVDLADALGRDPWTTAEALDVVRDLLFGAADPVALEGVFPGALSERGGGLAAVRAVTGRAGAAPDRGAWERAGVRLLALG